MQLLTVGSLLTLFNVAIFITILCLLYVLMYKPIPTNTKVSKPVLTNDYANEYDIILIGIHKSKNISTLSYYACQIYKFHEKYKGHKHAQKDTRVLLDLCLAKEDVFTMKIELN
jgi:hypothetical protein